jgi:RING-box protein 1
MEVESSQNSKKVFELKKWNAVAIWYWNTKIENCAICKQFLSEPCPLCMGDPAA